MKIQFVLRSKHLCLCYDNQSVNDTQEDGNAEIRTKHETVLCGKKVEFLNVKSKH